MSASIHSLIQAASSSRNLHIRGLKGAVSLFAARLMKERKAPLCLITANEEQLEILRQDVQLFSNAPVSIYPSFEIPPYTPLSPDSSTVAARITTLHQLQNSEPGIIIVSVEALLRRVLPRCVLDRNSELIMAGEETNRDELIAFLIRAGYESRSMVRSEGDFSLRGGIIDIFSPAPHGRVNAPLRLDFFGDCLESIRLFDPVSQRSMDEISEAVILPASDILFADENRVAAMQRLQKQAESYAGSGRTAIRLSNVSWPRIVFPVLNFFCPWSMPVPKPWRAYSTTCPKRHPCCS